MTQLTLTLKMTTAQVVETSVTVNYNSPIQDYVHLDDHTQPTCEMTSGFKTLTVFILCCSNSSRALPLKDNKRSRIDITSLTIEFKSRLSLIVQFNVVLYRTFVVDSD